MNSEKPSLELYLLIHNLDSHMLRGDKCQQVLGQLASISNIHVLASIDHINAPLRSRQDYFIRKYRKCLAVTSKKMW
ncbi:unnamed protein product [Ranitomeya imitator]|uniref:Origin recognition complex subunit 2 n=1 Tax=Ranitomeya imitator TaxID=111125 RepID=A0ABN9MM00_9NEOB|nr:unnamed protein product [Ranitomeya imitator]